MNENNSDKLIFAPSQKISLKEVKLDEKWLQKKIAEDPSAFASFISLSTSNLGGILQLIAIRRLSPYHPKSLQTIYPVYVYFV